jgi:competence ComEA-like helix-hairpin-helix protein
MFEFTLEEKRVIIFLAGAALLGIGIQFLFKLCPAAPKLMRIAPNQIKLEINKAPMEELVSTRIISEKLARKIIEYRNRHGCFRSIEELKEVKGIGEYRYEKLKNILCVE